MTDRVFMIDPVVAMLHDVNKDRWHPIVFAGAPLPGQSAESKIIRHRSVGHHTAGFETREAAEVHARVELAPRIVGCRFALDHVIDWDGKDTPATVEFAL